MGRRPATRRVARCPAPPSRTPDSLPVAHLLPGLDNPDTWTDLDSLAVRAKARGRPEDLDALARAVAQGVRRKAAQYAVHFGVDAEDLAAEGMGRLPHALRSYGRQHGGFFNYFIFAAARWMARKGARWAAVARRERTNRRLVAVRPLARPAAARPPDPSLVRRVHLALERVPPPGGTLIKLVHGFRGPPMLVREAGAALGLTPAEAREVYRLGKAKLATLGAALIPPPRDGA